MNQRLFLHLLLGTFLCSAAHADPTPVRLVVCKVTVTDYLGSPGNAHRGHDSKAQSVSSPLLVATSMGQMQKYIDEFVENHDARMSPGDQLRSDGRSIVKNCDLNVDVNLSPVPETYSTCIKCPESYDPQWFP